MAAVANGVQNIATTQYPYRQLNVTLNEIRLLDVSAGSGTDLVRCSVRHAPLSPESKPEYETVSYVWGDARHRSVIQLDNLLVSVPASSEAALRRLRQPTQSRRLWIDAICINQNDTKERGQQVAMMYDIYRQSCGNLIYLGEDVDFLEAALQNVQDILYEIRMHTEDFETLYKTLYDKDGEHKLGETDRKSVV